MAGAGLRIRPTGMFRICWRETDGPEVTRPDRTGFGSVVIERMIAQSLGGAVELDFKPQGIVWRLAAPVGRVEQ